MSHEVLYRKYRPQSFDEVIGQDAVVKALKGAIANSAIAHAYLFAGSRGIGKTSIARIFAREIGTSGNDVYEIDAASNRGIDDIRALRDAVAVLPFESNYKVYIIDEVHMLTKEAFNALLKTLEEPPRHVVFILATTEIHKLPETIVSRCQVFEFKRPSAEILRDTVALVAKKEGYSIEPAAAELVALVGDGSFRDAHGTLERVIAAKVGGKSGAKSAANISRDDVEEATGSPKSELVRGFVGALAAKDAPAAFASLAKVREKSFDPKLFLELALSLARLALLRKMGVAAASLSEEDERFVSATPAVDSKLIRGLLGAFDYIGVSPIRELPLELAVLDIVGEKEQNLFQ
ncbi:MAG: DNA polymerase III subunit gamma/tau [Patescibacteria group bacterium]|nr:DNA polymerase III subunit gamma/tau [Patescibacteria group bacterium]MDE2116530.1 DNA polymerase III subunit gamma/tau [Patescibacteria group bacterium]